MKESPWGADGKKLIRRLAASTAECAEDARRYGACVKLHLESVQQGAPRACIEATLQSARRETCSVLRAVESGEARPRGREVGLRQVAGALTCSSVQTFRLLIGRVQ